ncbi:MAG: hypothetical protein KDC53_16700, partial [Saprospiraceae bacterium]|nr:hypothetical protein [Saprospiraceae bacterium]
MKYLFSFALSLLLFTLNAQKEYTIAVSSGKLKISEVNMVTIEGYDGPNVVVEIEDYNDEVDERAQGLKLISPSGLI